MQPRSSRSHSAPQPDLIFLCPSDLLSLGLGLHLIPGEAVLSSASARCSPHPHCCSPLAGLLPLSLTHHWRHVGNSGLPQCDQQVLGNKRFSLSLPHAMPPFLHSLWLFLVGREQFPSIQRPKSEMGHKPTLVWVFQLTYSFYPTSIPQLEFQ